MAEEVKKQAEVKSAPKGRARTGGKPVEEKSSEFIERVVKIRRISKVVKGGKNFGFNAVVVAGDGKGNVGVGMGKGKEVADAISKGSTKAKKNFRSVTLKGNSIPHVVIGKFKATKVILKPAGPGTGVIAGGPVRALCDAVGIKDILTKSLGSRNPLNVIRATMNGFDQLRMKRRG
jgi:small subunit ribosomal protein S5